MSGHRAQWWKQRPLPGTGANAGRLPETGAFPRDTQRGEGCLRNPGKHGDEGMSTAEYAIGTLAAAALAAVLYMIVTGDSVTSALTSLIEQALSVDF